MFTTSASLTKQLFGQVFLIASRSCGVLQCVTSYYKDYKTQVP